MEKSSREATAMAIARSLARKRFKYDPDREAKISDAMSIAWEFAQDASENATENSIAWYAVKRVLAGRNFSQSERSIDNPRDARRPLAAQREYIRPEVVSRPGDDPAEIVCFWMTFLPWLESMSPRTRRIAIAMILGDRTQSIAEQFQLSPGRVSQLRRELKEEWDFFTA